MNISNNIKVEQLGLTREALDAFSQLAIQVELRERQRYSVSKTVDQLIALLNHAHASKSVEIGFLYIRVLEMLSQDSKNLLKAMGAVEPSEHTQPMGSDKKSGLQADNRHKFGARS